MKGDAAYAERWGKNLLISKSLDLQIWGIFAPR
jgi:hypothetical protein